MQLLVHSLISGASTPIFIPRFIPKPHFQPLSQASTLRLIRRCP